MTISNFLHSNTKLFTTFIQETAAKTSFIPELIEKDYFCSLILQTLYQHKLEEPLIFKGGTLLNKVHAGFYRLSEDLDFSLSIPYNVSRNERSSRIKPFKSIVEHIAVVLPGIKLEQGLTGSNNSLQYNAIYTYQSAVGIKLGTIFFEIGLRDQTFQPPIQQMAHTLLHDPYRNQAAISEFLVTCLTKHECYAEKLRAALSRKTPAIRDLFDIEHAWCSKIINFEDKNFLTLVKHKLNQPETGFIDISFTKKEILKAQTSSQLAPVLRQSDFERFDFDLAWDHLQTLAQLINNPS